MPKNGRKRPLPVSREAVEAGCFDPLGPAPKEQKVKNRHDDRFMPGICDTPHPLGLSEKGNARRKAKDAQRLEWGHGYTVKPERLYS